MLYPCNGVHKVSVEEMDLSVITAKPSRQSAGAVRWTNSTVNTIRRTVVTRDKCVILSLYKSLLIPRVGIGLLGTGMKSFIKPDIGKLEIA